jgi:hypothetical protein
MAIWSRAVRGGGAKEGKSAMAAYIDIDDVWVSAGDALARFTVRLSERSATDTLVD